MGRVTLDVGRECVEGKERLFADGLGGELRALNVGHEFPAEIILVGCRDIDALGLKIL